MKRDANKAIDMLVNAVQEDPDALEGMSAALKNNETVVLAAVKRCGYALEYASDALKNNKLVVLAAVKASGYALEYARRELRNNESFQARCVYGRRIKLKK